jgi:hypothetical protein
MFNWFKTSDYKNVVPLFPDKVPYIETPEQKSETYYSIGVTSDSRISIKVGYTTLTMNRKGIQDLIQQLQVFKDHLPEENNDT